MADLACDVCGLGTAPVQVCETWAGTYQAACTHAVCEECLSRHIAAALPRCRGEGQLRVKCCVEGCRKMMPQTLVFHASRPAQGLALEIDKATGDLQEKYGVLPIDWIPQTCHVCNDYVGPLLKLTECGDKACEMCWMQWVDEQLPTCRAMTEVRIRCLGVGCQQPFTRDLAHLISSEFRAFEQDLARRQRLQNNPLYPADMQVNCPQLGCVGLGYLGFDTVMCFLCEHQWNAMGEAPDDDMPTGVMKQCPRCQVQIEKNGGCDHMMCRCGFEFWWSTMSPYRNNQGHAIAAQQLQPEQAQVVAAQPAQPQQVQQVQAPAAAAQGALDAEAAAAAQVNDTEAERAAAAAAEQAAVAQVTEVQAALAVVVPEAMELVRDVSVHTPAGLDLARAMSAPATMVF